jgi:hypothetical protein
MHASSDIVGPFYEWVEKVYHGKAAWTDETFSEWNGEEYQVGRLIGRLWNCTNIVSDIYWSLVDMPPTSTHTVAAMVRHIKSQYRNPN